MKWSWGLWHAFSEIALPFLSFLHNFADTEANCGPVSCLISCLTELSKFSLYTQYVSPAHMPWIAWLSWLSPLEKVNKIELFTTQLPSAHKCLFSCLWSRDTLKTSIQLPGRYFSTVMLCTNAMMPEYAN